MHGFGNMDCWQQTCHVMFVEMVATRFETVRGRTDVGGDARIVIATRIYLSGMGASLDLTPSWS